MRIKCLRSQKVNYIDKDGLKKTQVLKPGDHQYPNLSPKDTMVAATLFTLRKHKFITFEARLPQDIELLKSAPKDVDKEQFLADKVLLKPNPNGRVVLKQKGKKNVSPGSGAENALITKSTVSASGDKKQGKVSSKG